MKKIIALIITCCAMLCGITATADNYGVSVYVDGVKLSFDQEPIIEDGRTLVPVRAIFEALGAKVEWDGTTQGITATQGSNIVVIKIGEYWATVNGEIKNLDVPATIYNERTLVPLRFISESFDCDVEWDGVTRSVYIATRNSNQTVTVTPTQTPINELVVYDVYEYTPWCPDFGDIAKATPKWSVPLKNDTSIGYAYEYLYEDVTDSEINAFTKILEAEGYVASSNVSGNAIAVYYKGSYSVGVFYSEGGLFGNVIDIIASREYFEASANANNSNYQDDTEERNRELYEKEVAELEEEYEAAIKIVKQQKKTYLDAMQSAYAGSSGGYMTSAEMTAAASAAAPMLAEYDRKIEELEEELEYNIEVLKAKYGIDD